MNTQQVVIDHLKTSPLLTPHFRSNPTYTFTQLQSFQDTPIFMSEHGERSFVNGIFETRGNSIKFALELIPDVSDYTRQDWRIQGRKNALSYLTVKRQNGTYVRLINFNTFLKGVSSASEFQAAMVRINTELSYIIQTGYPSHKWKHQNNRCSDWKKLFAEYP